MDVENMDVFVERIRTILAAVHLSDTFSAAGFTGNLESQQQKCWLFSFWLTKTDYSASRTKRT
ncbi:hypothetical protein BCF53_11847 [Reinekea marinisedimentorum]|uniref:Uncharacterized protein n=1 Tax=Reinekea marinisedimentorum TaxID=230495 RepID=A0A4R3HWL6_9GAMM|nr:hypothetical protein BCF53_11847 [Reinekea marinisedimentorum]